MSRQATASRSSTASEDAFVASIDQHVGVPEYTRRLADKILAAFNHAYAAGEHEIAGDLRAALLKLDQRTRDAGPTARATSVIDEADRWVAFVRARDRYKSLTAALIPDPAAVNEAMAGLTHS